LYELRCKSDQYLKTTELENSRPCSREDRLVQTLTVLSWNWCAGSSGIC